VEEKIFELKEKNYTIHQIAEELNLSPNQVKYRLYKRGNKQKDTKDQEAGLKLLTGLFLTEQTQQDQKGVKQVEMEHREAQQREVKYKNVEPLAKGIELPQFYSEDIIHLMLVSPHTLYTYWEITWPKMELFAEYLQVDYRFLQQGLRLYDVTDIYFNGDNAHSYTDFFIDKVADHWHITNIESNRNYVIDFGVHHNWRFIPIVRSNVVHVS
jgi:hypothetical protein